MKIRGRRMDAAPRLMIIPMIDIIFFLLVFFMMSMLFMTEQRTMPLQLPTATGGASQTGPALVLSVDAGGNLFLDRDPVTPPELWARARLEASGDPDVRFVIRADRETPHGKVVGVLDGLRRAGITRVGIAVEGETQ